MVWAGITHDGKTPLIFIKEGVKVDQVVYQTMIQDKVLPWAQDHFGDRHWTFQQDSAPSHKALNIQKWIEANFPDFINSQQWPPNSPDLNPLDYSIWSILESSACKKLHTSIAALKRTLKKVWDEISMEPKLLTTFPKN